MKRTPLDVARNRFFPNSESLMLFTLLLSFRLRVEHIVTDAEEMTLTLDFLGKDSMRHFQTYKLVKNYGDIGKQVFKVTLRFPLWFLWLLILEFVQNFVLFCENKAPADQVFHRLDVSKRCQFRFQSLS